MEASSSGYASIVEMLLAHSSIQINVQNKVISFLVLVLWRQTL